MNTSLKFKHTGSNTVKIVETLSANQSILRYLYYLTDNPLALSATNQNGETVSQPDITDSLLGTNIFLTPYYHTHLTSDKVIMFISPDNGFMNKQGVLPDTYKINILCPHSYYILNGQRELRVFSIAHEIAKEIDGQLAAGIGKPTIVKWKTSVVNDEYAKLTLFLDIGSATVKDGY